VAVLIPVAISFCDDSLHLAYLSVMREILIALLTHCLYLSTSYEDKLGATSKTEFINGKIIIYFDWKKCLTDNSF